MRTFFLIVTALLLISQVSYAQGKTKPAAKATAVKLKTEEFPDGTGTIGLPPGWRIDGSYRGTVGCKGPVNGLSILMGSGQPVTNPNHPVGQMPGSELVKGPRARVGDIPGAIRSILEQNNSRLISLRSRPAPPASPGVPAYYYLYEYQKPDGLRITALGYFTTIGSEGDVLPYWQLYSSFVNAPSDQFMKQLPTMMAMWNSYRPNGQKPKAGSEGAMIDAAIQDDLKRRRETLKEQQEAFDRMQEKFKNALINN